LSSPIGVCCQSSSSKFARMAAYRGVSRKIRNTLPDVRS